MRRSSSLTTDEVLLEAPNWAPDGRYAAAQRRRPAVETRPSPRGCPELRSTIDDLPPINNDHVLDSPRGLIYLSANDGHLYVAPIAGGAATRVTHDSSRYHFLHGVSPDGTTLAFVDLPRGDFSARRPSRAHPGRWRRDHLSRRRAAATSTGPSTPRTASGSTSTPRSSGSGPVTPSSPESRPTAGPWSAWWPPTPSTGSRTCHRTAKSRRTSASPPAPSVIRPI